MCFAMIMRQIRAQAVGELTATFLTDEADSQHRCLGWGSSEPVHRETWLLTRPGTGSAGPGSPTKQGVDEEQGTCELPTASAP